MLLQAAVSISNTERWALELEETPPPVELAGMLRTTAYEVAVVDRFHLIAQRYFERAGSRAVWERPFQTGKKGRPKSIDVVLFQQDDKRETRVELGRYSKVKLEADTEKLAGLNFNTLAEYPKVRSLVALWDERASRLTHAAATRWMHDFTDDAKEIADATDIAVKPMLSSCVDLFAAKAKEYRYVVVALFEVG